MDDYTIRERGIKSYLLKILQSLLAAVMTILLIANVVPAAKDFAPHFHLLAIEVCHYLIFYKAWRSHLHQNTNIYNTIMNMITMLKNRKKFTPEFLKMMKWKTGNCRTGKEIGNLFILIYWMEPWTRF